MATATVSRAANSGGRNFSYERTVTANSSILRDNEAVPLPAAKAGTLTTRASATAGTLTMDGGHGFTDGQVIDIYWTTGQVTTATIGIVAGDSVPFTGATGTLPIATTAITAMVQVVEPFSFAVADLKALFVSGSERSACSVTLRNAAAAAVGVATVAAGGKDYVWDDENGADDPVSADVATIAFTHGDSTAARRVTTLALVD